MKLLLIEDYFPLVNSLKEGLSTKGYSLDCAMDGEEGLWYAENHPYDVIILDLMLPKLNGLRVLEILRKEGNLTPVLILTAKGDISDRVKGLDAGADDYLVKPFSIRELMARVRALVRRNHQLTSSIIEIGDLRIDTKKHSVRRGETAIALTRKEFAVLECLAIRKESIVSRQELLENLYDFDDEIGSNVIEVYIKSLRKKIDSGYEKKLIHTRRGHGYHIGDLIE